MYKPPFIFINDFLKSYNKYKICKYNKKKFLECMNDMLNDKNINCNQYYEKLIKYNCII